MPPIIPRAKLVIADHGPAVAAVLLVLGLAAFGGAAWTITHPPTVEVTEQVTTSTVGTEVQSSTVVTGNTSLWDRGTTLEDKAYYPLESAPNLTLRVHTTVPTGERVHVSQELTLVYHAARDGEVFWEADQPLVADEESVQDGDLTSTATFDVRRVRAHLDAINEDIAGIGRAQAYLRLNVTYRSESYTGSMSKTAPMAVLSSGYWIGGSLDAENSHQTPVTREVTQPPDHETALAFGLIGFLCVGGAGGVVYASSRRFDRAAIAEELDRHRYQEWISHGRLGEFVSGQDVSMDSLKDLVDVAIDTNNRVVFDRQRDLYAVVAGRVIYYYDPHHPEPAIDIEPETGIPVTSDGGQTSAFEYGPRPAPDQDSEADSASGGATGSGDGPAALSTDRVTVEREVDRENDQVIVTYRLRTDADTAVTAEVADPAIDSLWALPGYEPADTLPTDEGLRFREVAAPHAERVVKYVVPDDVTPGGEGDDPAEMGPAPEVRRVTAIDPAADEADRDGRTQA